MPTKDVETIRVGTRADEIQVVGRADGAVRPIAVPEGVTKGAFFHIVSAFDALFRATGTLPEAGDVVRLTKLARKTVSKVLATPEFAEAMRLRGVGFAAEDGLSAQQLATLNALEDFSDGRTLTAKLRDVGVSRTQFNGWLKDPLFYELYDKRVESHLKGSHLTALSTIMTGAESGDVGAAKLLLEINGRYNTQNAELQNARAVVQALVEAIQRHVKDEDTVQAIINEVSLAQQVARLSV